MEQIGCGARNDCSSRGNLFCPAWHCFCTEFLHKSNIFCTIASAALGWGSVCRRHAKAPWLVICHMQALWHPRSPNSACWAAVQNTPMYPIMFLMMICCACGPTSLAPSCPFAMGCLCPTNVRTWHASRYFDTEQPGVMGMRLSTHLHGEPVGLVMRRAGTPLPPSSSGSVLAGSTFGSS